MRMHLPVITNTNTISIEPTGLPAIHVLYARDSMGSIDVHQSAGLCALPEAAQDNPQNLSTARTTVLCYVYQTLFPHPRTKEKKRSGYARLISTVSDVFKKITFNYNMM